jgi:hypothetical protein
MIISIFKILTIVTILSLTCALFYASHAQAQTTPKIKDIGLEQPKTILYVGNSLFYYNDSMHRYVSGLSTAADPTNLKHYRSTSITISGGGLNWYDVKSYCKRGGVASYSFVDDNEIVFNKFDKPFAVVIMNDCSQCPIHPQLNDVFLEYVRKHCQRVVTHGAKPVLFMTWAYADKPEMTAQLAEQYTMAGNNNDALVIPAGLGFAKALSKNPRSFSMTPTSGIPVFSQRICLHARYTLRSTRSRRLAIPMPAESMPKPRVICRKSPRNLSGHTLENKGVNSVFV